ncbi:MAG TPA: MarR family transcriptional regulator [Caulobacteraceae bacterium]|nr:MarR family transcriptional regulator [Caulobacteraceae bacterium]
MADRSETHLTQADYRALADFRLALRRFLAFSEGGAESQKLTPQQHQALLAIRAHDGAEPISIGELADWLMIKNHSAVGLVARLAEAGLATRESSPADRRRVLLRLTPEGERRLEILSRNNLAALGASAPVLQELLKALERVST